MNKIVVKCILFHWQNFIVPTEHAKEIKFILLIVALPFCLFFVNIRFLHASLKHIKNHIPVKLCLGFPKSGYYNYF